MDKDRRSKLLISVEETARLLDLAPQSIYNMLSKKRFPIRAVRVGRLVKFKLAEVEDYVKAL